MAVHFLKNICGRNYPLSAIHDLNQGLFLYKGLIREMNENIYFDHFSS